jgi:prepilin-type N-terminal cleavage/methylation domain-containing protein
MISKKRENNKYLQPLSFLSKQNKVVPRKIKVDKKGFSLIEVMAALFIVMVGMLGVMSLVLQNIQVKEINTNRVIAHQLAQEGIELIREQRDTNWIECENITLPDSICWLLDIEPGFTYKIDFNDDKPDIITGIDEARLYKIVSGEFANMYAHDVSPDKTPFYRMIEINALNPHTVRVTVTVKWQERADMYSYSAETLLFNWK